MNEPTSWQRASTPFPPATVETPTLPAQKVSPRSFAISREVVGVTLLLGATAVLYLWNLAASGWANAYYSAAAMAGAQDWQAWLFGSFDAGNALTVDKTPAALWVMGLSVRLFGLSSWSILVPQALMGVAAVGLLYATIRRAVGPLGAFIAAGVFALTPVAALMFRFDNPDALLVLLLVVAAYATVRGIETGSTRWLVLAGIAVGFGFLAKMLQAFLVIPALTAVVMVASPVSIRRRLVQVAAAAVAVIMSSGWYIALVELWPADARPFIGGSQTNSIIELLFGYNGFGRITGNEVGRVGGGGPFSDGAGLWRLFDGEVATEIAWLLPLALFAGFALLWARRRAPRTDPVRAQTILWLGWLLVTGLVFSLMQGIFHEYYTVALAPAIGALVGLGFAVAWRERDRYPLAVSSLAGIAVAGSALWTAHMLTSLTPTWLPWLAPVVVIGGVAAGVAIVGVAILRRDDLRPAALAAALLVTILTPAVASVATAAEPHTGAIPIAAPDAQGGPGGGPRGFGQRGAGGAQFGQGRQFAPPGIGGGQGFGNGQGFGGPPTFGARPFGGGGARGGGPGGLLDAQAADPSVVAALQAEATRYRWTAATTGSNNAAGLALASRTSVMSIGGFNGTDPAPTLAQFQSYVQQGLIHYYVGGSDAGGFRGAIGGSQDAAAIAAWVETNFEPTTVGGMTLYDLTAG
jgi:4-amino-4-deoxy-L-arabinose transferase-like glycosyltransferase